MNRVLCTAAITALSLGLLGCEEKKPAGTASTNTAPTDQASTPSSVTEQSPSPAASSATLQGTADLFIDSMRKRDFDTALTLLDPACEAFRNVTDVVNQLKNNPGIPADAVEVVKTFLAANFAGMTAQDVIEDGDRGRVTLVPTEGEPKTIDANRLDGKWLLIAPDSIFDRKAAPPPSAPATPVPMPLPTPAESAPQQPSPNPEPK